MGRSTHQQTLLVGRPCSRFAQESLFFPPTRLYAGPTKIFELVGDHARDFNLFPRAVSVTKPSSMTLPIPDLKPWFLTYDDLGETPLSWPEFYQNGNPVEVEVGSGRGMFLVNASVSNPNTNFLGMELDYTEGRHTAKRLQKRDLPNARLLGGDARIGLPKFIPSASVAAVHVYFPDPWWKRKHRARRIFDAWFLTEVSRILVDDGILHAWTDVEEYFQVMTETVTANIDFVELPPPEERPAAHDMDYHTSFERKKRKAGLPIYRGRWQRIARTNQPTKTLPPTEPIKGLRSGPKQSD